MDINLTGYGRKEINITEIWDAWLRPFSGSLHMTIQMAVLIDTIKALISELCWCSFNISYNQDHTMAVITHDEYSDIFYWKGESLEEYWDCILNALIYLEDDGKGHRHELIVDNGGDMTLLIHKGTNVED